ncbi:hypothetical protein JW835_00995 [bacterium]|nr:hypothetical protein [bacterium]
MRRISLLIIFILFFDILIAKNRYMFYHDYSTMIKKSNDSIQYIYSEKSSKGELSFFLFESQSNNKCRILTLDNHQSDLLEEIYFRKNGNILAIFNDNEYGQILVMINKDISVEITAPERDIISGFSISSDEGLSVNYHRERSFPDLSFSPNGNKIIFCQDDSVTIEDPVSGEYRRNLVIRQLDFGEITIKTVFTDTLQLSYLMVDRDIHRFILTWSSSKENQFYLTDFIQGQLINTFRNLWKFDIKNASLDLVSSFVEEVYCVSRDDMRILFVNNDETCCSGINYTNNQLFEYHLTDHSLDTLFCEYSEFSNENCPSEHRPISSMYSPGNDKIVFDIETLIISNALNCEMEKIDKAKEFGYFKSYDIVIYDRFTRNVKKYNNARYKQWFDDNHLIISPLTVKWDSLKREWVNDFSNNLILNINTMNTKILKYDIHTIFSAF